VTSQTQRQIFCRSFRMLPTQHSLHKHCKVDEHDSLHTVSLQDLASSFIASVVVVIDYLTLMVLLWRRLGKSSRCSELVVVIDNMWTCEHCELVIMWCIKCGRWLLYLWTSGGLVTSHSWMTWLVNLWILWFIVHVFFWISLCGSSQFRLQFVRCSG
jgi:hypothetical protein